MGKIPSKKRNKIKDPAKQRLLRDSKIKDKINNPPEDPDFQHVPKSATRLAEVMEKMRSSVGIKKKPKGKKNQPSAFFKTLGVKVTKEKDESSKKFIYRVHQACEQVLKESKFEEKYKVKIQRNSETNEVEKLVKQKNLKLDDEKSELKKGKKRKFGKFNKEEGDDDSNGGTKKNKKKMKKEEEHIRDFSDKRDIVKFGDVVHAPPTLMVPHRIAKIKTTNNPGDRDLLLKTVMKRNSIISKTESGNRKHQSKMDDKAKTSQVPDKKGKRKNLPTVIRQKLEAQQQEVIAAYKKLKKQRGSNNL